MSGHHDPLSDCTNADVTARLLRVADPRTQVSAHRAGRVRRAVRAEWQAHTRARVIRSRMILVASLATAATVVVVIGRMARIETPSPSQGERVATVAQVDGVSRAQRDDAVQVGQWIETDDSSRLALRFHDGTSVRLDVRSRLRVLSSSAIELAAGAAYVDTEREDGRFEVRTALATARDMGTQFEVRLIDESLRLRVRSGMVELRDRTQAITGRPGTEIMLSSTGAVTRPVAAHGAEWDWTTRVSPPLEMDGASLASFLQRVAREHGWNVEYRDPSLARDAEAIILHGSVRDLTAREALDVAIATSGLRHRVERGSLVVRRPNMGEGPEQGGAR